MPDVRPPGMRGAPALQPDTGLSLADLVRLPGAMARTLAPVAGNAFSDAAKLPYTLGQMVGPKKLAQGAAVTTLGSLAFGPEVGVPAGIATMIPDEAGLPGDALGSVMGMGVPVKKPLMLRGVQRWAPGQKLADIDPQLKNAIPRADEAKTASLEDVQRYIQMEVRRKLGEVPAAAPAPSKMRRMLRLGRAETADQQEQPNTGLNFYDEDSALAQKQLEQLFPELKDPTQRTIQTAISSVMSNNSNPQQEAYWGGKIWAEKRKNPGGEIPLMQPGGETNWPAQGARIALEKIERMRQDLGDQGLADFLRSIHTVNDIRKFRPGAEGKATDLVPGSIALGPKLGRYFLDVMGIPHEGSTVDVWDVRGGQRRMGRLFDAAGNPIEVPTPESDRPLFMDVHKIIADETGLTRKQVQSLLWHYEKGLYERLGAPKNSTNAYKRSEGTSRLLSDLLGGGGGQ